MIYSVYTYSISGREFTKYTVIYGVYKRFWPTLHIAQVHTNSTRTSLRHAAIKTSHSGTPVYFSMAPQYVCRHIPFSAQRHKPKGWIPPLIRLQQLHASAMHGNFYSSHCWQP
jgi:hypothetical protein